MAEAAVQKTPPSIAGSRIERRTPAFFNPAPGTKVITSELDGKIRKALRSTTRRIAFHLYLRYVFLSLCKPAVEIKQVCLHASRYFIRCLQNLIADGHCSDPFR